MYYYYAIRSFKKKYYVRIFKEDQTFKAHVFLPSTTDPENKERIFKFINKKGKQEELVIMADTEERLIDKCRRFIEKLISNNNKNIKNDYVVLEVQKIGINLKFQPMEIIAPSETNILNIEDVYIILEQNTRDKQYKVIRIKEEDWETLDIAIDTLDNNYYVIGKLSEDLSREFSVFEKLCKSISSHLNDEVNKVITDIQMSYSDIYRELNEKIDKMDDVPYIIKERMKELLINPDQEES